jgi:sugar phosphate permease
LPTPPDRPAAAIGPGYPPLARLLPRRVFYGWWVVVACTVMTYVTVGVGYYGLAVFLKPLQREHGWSNGVVSGATGLYFVISGISSFVVGPIIDRRGPKAFMAVGIVVTALGTTLVGFVETIPQLYLVYALIAVAYGMGASVAVSSMLARWFIDQRAKAMAVASTGVSLGGATLVPLGTALVDRGGLELATPVLGALVVLIALPTLLGLVVVDPARVGLQPDGRSGDRPPGEARLSAASQYRTWTRPEAGRTLSFWAVLVGFTMALATQTAVLIHQLSYLSEDGKLGSRSAAALAVTTTTIGSITARLLVGMFADSWDKRKLAVLLFVVQGLAVLAYTWADQPVSIYLVALTFGFTIGNVYMMQSLLVGEIFGLRSFATVMGVIVLAGQVGSGAGLVFMGWYHDVTGGYAAPFHVLGVVNLAAAVVISFARPPVAVPSGTAVAASSGAPAVVSGHGSA